jgi:nicotinate-nucleotide pyrophosphorylase (carboxylating)
MRLSVSSPQVKRLIRLAIEEDLGSGDITTESVVEKHMRVRARVIARGTGIAAGLSLIAAVTREFADDVAVRLKVRDGQEVSPGQTLAIIDGPARALLSAERTVLNFVQRLSGVATLTRKFVDAVAGTPARIYDTRKTTPGWRLLEKYAVRAGWGENHRMGLYDQVLIKDNHLAVMRQRGQGLSRAVAAIRAERPGVVIEVEADTEAGLGAAVNAGVDVILLDNMTVDQMASAVKLTRALSGSRRPILEASGGIEIDTVRAVASTGVDRISVGTMTHSAPALDIAIEFDREDAGS